MYNLQKFKMIFEVVLVTNSLSLRDNIAASDMVHCDQSRGEQYNADLLECILILLNERCPLHSTELAHILQQDHQKIIGAIKSIQTFGEVLKTSQVSSKSWELTEEGKRVADEGSYEALIFRSIPDQGIAQSCVTDSIMNAKIGISKALQFGWIELLKSENGPILKKKVLSIEDVTRSSLNKLRDKNFDAVSDREKVELKKRKLLTEVTLKSLLVDKGADFAVKLRKPETDLSAENLASGDWKTKAFKEYNFNALGVKPKGGHLHPLLKVRQEYREIFLEMGFVEMPTNRYVESSFWNFDALFVPQRHPARDAQDTFFICEPSRCFEIPEQYMASVSRVHSSGDYGSKGYAYEWREEEATKNVLRTHTTAISAQMLFRLARKRPFEPSKLFSIDRVFRNENLDATHLAEFHQIEGVVADRGLSLGHLIGILNAFFRKLGVEKLRFKPAYNPYTEPSMEIFGYHCGLRKWVEIGNSGVFRPEMLLPMGLPADVTVIAWGLSLERPAMIKYGIENIRDLIGPRVNLRMVQNNVICRVDK